MTSPVTSEFLARIGTEPDRTLLYYRRAEHSVGTVLASAAAWRDELMKAGVTEGAVVAFRGEYSTETCALFLALIEMRAILVPLTPAADTQLDGLLALANTEWMIDLTIEAGARIARLGTRQANGLLDQLRAARHPGLVVFSSGSTGAPKGIVHDFERVLGKFRKPRRGYRTLQFLLLDHFGGINTLLGALANGGVVVVAEDRQPIAVARLIEEARVELLPVTPTFLSLFIATGAHRQYSMESIELITYGTEVMTESALARVRNAFPHARLQQTYGLSETGVLRSVSKDSESVWVKVGGEGFETKIVGDILYIKSQSAMLGYLNAPDPFDDDGWFCTSDAVLQDGEWIRILGRTSDLINVGGQKVYPAEIETVLMSADNVVEASVTGEKHPLMGSVVAAKVVLAEPEEPGALRRRLRAFCLQRLAAFKVPVKFSIAQEVERSERFKKIRN